MDSSIRMLNTPRRRSLKTTAAAAFPDYLSRYSNAVPVHRHPPIAVQSSSVDAHYAIHSADRDEATEASQSLSSHSAAPPAPKSVFENMIHPYPKPPLGPNENENRNLKKCKTNPIPYPDTITTVI